MSEFAITALRSYLPVDAIVHNGEPQIELLEMADVKFTEPFFQDTVERWRQSNPPPTSIITDYDVLLQVAKLLPPCKPTGLIFHTSRCGSTLVANACRGMKNSRVIAEAPVVDKLISRLFTDAPQSSTRELIYLSLIKAVVKILGCPQIDPSNHYVLKFASPSILHIERIRRIWPTVPTVILYRHPLEVMVSNLRKIPHWMIIENNPQVAAAIANVSVENLEKMRIEEFCARALGGYYSAAVLAEREDPVFLVNYEELSLQTLRRVIEFLGFVPSPEDMSTIEGIAKTHSKDSQQLFRPDSVEKRRSASTLAVQMTEEWAQSAYLELLELDKYKSASLAYEQI